MKLSLFMFLSMCCYCGATEWGVKYTSDVSQEELLSLDEHLIEKRAADPTSVILTENPQASSSAASQTSPSTTPKSSATTTSQASPPTTSQASPTKTPQTSSTTTSLPLDTTTPITFIKQFTSQKYYNVTILYHSGTYYYDELLNHTRHEVLSSGAYLQAASVDIAFTMPFYGHNISSLHLTTGGFIYLSPYIHPYLTFSQYAAPLMANLDTKANNSEILYKDYQNESIVVEWRNVQLNDQAYKGQFTFQAKLYKNGTIIFVYKTIPVFIGDILTTNHLVKIGVSDAFYYDYIQNGVKYRRIYRYNAIEINMTMITPNTVVILDPLPTCNTFTNCGQCVTKEIDFKCSWCKATSKCSDGIDWYYQEWIESGCNTNAVNTSAKCAVTPITTMAATTKLPLTSASTTTPTPVISRASTTATTPPTTTTMISTTSTIPTTSRATTTITTSLPTTTTLPTTPSITTTLLPTTTTTSKSSTTTTVLPTSPKPSTTTTTMPTTKATPKPSTTTTMPTTTATPKPSTTTTMLTTTPTPKPLTTTNIPTTPIKTTAQPTTTIDKTMTSPKMTIQTSEAPALAAQQTSKKDDTVQTAIVVPVVLCFVLVIGIVGAWVYYAYTHPNTSSGQWLIEHRPSQMKQKFSDLFTWNTETGEKYKVKNEDMDIDMHESTA